MSKDAPSGVVTPANGSTLNNQSYGTTPLVFRLSIGRSSWMVKYRTGYGKPGAGAQTGPETLNAAPAGSGATTVALPVSGSRTPTPLPATYAMRPWVSAPSSGE